MKLVTWNVNSIKVRLERLIAFLERESPDVVCLQELKCSNDEFPHDVIEQAGYRAAVHGQKTYNGVAILTRDEPSAVRTGLGDESLDAHARLIGAEVGGTRVLCGYFPNGGEVGAEKWVFKLAWMAALERYLRETEDLDAGLVLTGDFNVAPRDADVAKPEKWAESVLCHPDARGAYEQLVALGLRDVFAEHHPAGGVFTWWDYRRLAFPKGDGLRIDLALVTPALAERCVEARVDRDERKGKQPSDHAPVVYVFS
ncbi:MAG: exodeoxyribonuclease III [Planctomycetota bacterium]